MIMATKKDIFREHLSAYCKTGKLDKGHILDHVCFITKLHRKAVIRRFNALRLGYAYKEERRGRSQFYTPDVTAALFDIWEAGDEVCGELLHPIIKEYVDILIRDDMWTHSDETTDKLLFISEATVKRRVRKFMKARRIKKGISSTKPSHIKHLVPIFMGPWKNKPPGFTQVDTVRHSNSASGDAVYTLNSTDAATLTSILQAQWNKGQEATRENMKKVKEKTPFPWLGAHPDTGSEFINRFVMEWCQEEHIDLSRSRPSHKNDNMYVEERNGHAIRKHIGYITLDCPEAVDALNQVYDVLVPYLMHFVAVRRMVEKEKLSSRYRRRYEKIAKTPYQRILEHAEVSFGVKEKLRLEHAKLNPLVLKHEMEKRLQALYNVQKRYGKRRY
jgi:hypothetical protein